MTLSSDSTYSYDEAHHLHRTYQVQLAALACSGVSVVTSVITFYWFWRMDKLFRHRLIMLLIYGDLMRSTWYLISSIYSLARDTVTTNSRFCLSSGFFIQYGTESSDYAVLVVAIHTALQVFRPATKGGSDGLYEYRYYVYSGGLLIPSAMSGLAFVNPDSAYLFIGGFCTLPLRPFWYRLALAWIPRYLIATIIISLTCIIYAYVGFEFRSYRTLTQEMQTLATGTLGLSRIDRDVEVTAHASKPKTAGQESQSALEGYSIAQDIDSSQCREPGIVFTSTTYGEPGINTRFSPIGSTQLSPRSTISRRPPLVFIPSGTSIKPSTTNQFSNPVSPFTIKQDHSLSTVPLTEPNEDQPPAHDNSPAAAVQRQIERRRRRINRQLRLMFIYPLAYTLMWLIPFIHHCMNYSDYWVNHPLWFFRIGATICVTSMGFVDCIIFSLREKPWRNIETSDGTVWGSLAVWRSPCESIIGSVPTSVVADGSRSTTFDRFTPSSARIARVRSNVHTSGSSDLTRLAAGQARIRLEAEREERTAVLAEKMRLGMFGSGESAQIGLEEKGKEAVVA